tara:strand:+ start:70 stop:528 length:459 start_codon:yes stop_codon:yes gene_type:complete
MILISHRGNINGRIPERENDPEYLMEAMKAGYSVEADVWMVDNQYWLGHDEPTYKVDDKFLQNDKIWFHAKNIEALYAMSSDSQIHYFWHQEDDFALTSKGYIWTYPRKKLTNRSICVLTSDTNHAILERECAGICSDYIGSYKITDEKDLL